MTTQGMRAIVTGAASGIGRATALRLHRDSVNRCGQPARLVIADISADPLEETRAMLVAEGAEAVVQVADLTDPDVPARVVQAAQDQIGGLDALISNAGIIHVARLLELTLADYERTFAINTRATWLLAKAAHPMLKAARGAIVATASMAAQEPTPQLGAYSPSKAALVMMIRQMACDWGPDGIRANTVSPGSTNTNISGNAGLVPKPTRRVGNNPLGIISEPEDQAVAISFLAGPEARFITGADLLVDGGACTQLTTMSGMANPAGR